MDLNCFCFGRIATGRSIKKKRLNWKQQQRVESNGGNYLGAIRLTFSSDRFIDERPASSNLLSFDCAMCSYEWMNKMKKNKEQLITMYGIQRCTLYVAVLTRMIFWSRINFLMQLKKNTDVIAPSNELNTIIINNKSLFLSSASCRPQCIRNEQKHQERERKRDGKRLIIQNWFIIK